MEGEVKRRKWHSSLSVIVAFFFLKSVGLGLTNVVQRKGQLSFPPALISQGETRSIPTRMAPPFYFL